MNLKFLIIAAFTILVTSSIPAMSGENIIKTQLIDGVVKIDEDCSATNIELNKEIFQLTAAHCTKDRGEGFIVVEIRNTKDHQILSYKKLFYDTVRWDEKKDLALLKVRDPDYKPSTVKVADKLLVDEGSPVWVVGYPLALTRTTTIGLFNGYQTGPFHSEKETTKFRASPNVDGGNSGGVLAQFNEASQKFELIGVTSMKYRSNEFMNLFVTLDDIREFLRINNQVPTNSNAIDLK